MLPGFTRLAPACIASTSQDSSQLFSRLAGLVRFAGATTRRAAARFPRDPFDGLHFRNLMSNKLYVGNLSFNMTEASLTEAFAPFGKVTRATIVTDRDTGRARGF